MEKNDIVVISDSFGFKHIVKIIRTAIDSYSGMVLYSLGETNFTTINFSDNDIEIELDKDYNISNIDEDYPELWI